jgi:hypothetical protein
MAPNINNPGGVKNDPDEIRDAVVSDATRFPGGFIDEQVTKAGAPVSVARQFDVNTAVVLDSFDVSSQTNSMRGVSLLDNGSILGICGRSPDSVFLYDLSTNFDITTATVSSSVDLSSQISIIRGFAVSSDGGKLFGLGSSTDKVYEYALSTDFDVSTASFSQSFDIGAQDTSHSGLNFSNTGKTMHTTGTDNSNVYEYDLTTAFDVSTASFFQSKSINGQTTDPTGVEFNQDGTVMYVVSNSTTQIFQYDVSQSFDVQAATFNQALDVSSQLGTATGVAVRGDGGRLHVCDRFNGKLFQFALGELVGGL